MLAIICKKKKTMLAMQPASAVVVRVQSAECRVQTADQASKPHHAQLWDISFRCFNKDAAERLVSFFLKKIGTQPYQYHIRRRNMRIDTML